MKYYFALLLLIALFSCEKEETVRLPEAPKVTDFIIGATGGWGGGYAFKITDGQLQRSVERTWLGAPEQIANDVEFVDYEDEDSVDFAQLELDFSEAVFADLPFKFDCKEQAWDGQCTYIL